MVDGPAIGLGAMFIQWVISGDIVLNVLVKPKALAAQSPSTRIRKLKFSGYKKESVTDFLG